jgi:hypothetical protein
VGSNVFVSSGLSYSNHKDENILWVLNTNSEDVYSKFRTDLTYKLSSKININAGAEYEYNEDNFKGTVPQLSYNLRLDALT